MGRQTGTQENTKVAKLTKEQTITKMNKIEYRDYLIQKNNLSGNDAAKFIKLYDAMYKASNRTQIESAAKYLMKHETLVDNWGDEQPITEFVVDCIKKGMHWSAQVRHLLIKGYAAKTREALKNGYLKGLTHQQLNHKKVFLRAAVYKVEFVVDLMLKGFTWQDAYSVIEAPGFSNSRTAYMAIKDGVDVKVVADFANGFFNIEQMEEIRRGTKTQPQFVQYYTQPLYSAEQMHELRMAFLHGLEYDSQVKYIASNAFNAAQMKALRQAFELGLEYKDQILWFADPIYNPLQMKALANGFNHGLQYTGQMEYVCRYSLNSKQMHQIELGFYYNNLKWEKVKLFGADSTYSWRQMSQIRMAIANKLPKKELEVLMDKTESGYVLAAKRASYEALNLAKEIVTKVNKEEQILPGDLKYYNKHLKELTNVLMKLQ